MILIVLASGWPRHSSRDAPLRVRIAREDSEHLVGGHDADELPVLDDRQAAHPMLLHRGGGLRNGCLGAGRDHVAMHQLTDSAAHSAVASTGRTGEVMPGQNTDDVVVLG